MINSLAELGLGAEHASYEDWNTVFKQPSDERLISLADMRDPLADYSFGGVEPISVYGFRKNKGSWAIVYFWCQDFENISYKNLSAKDNIGALISLGVLLSENGDRQLSFSQLREILGEDLKDTLLETGDMDDTHINWESYRGLKFATCYKSLTDSERFSAGSIGKYLGLHNDYFRLRSPVWSNMPITFLYGLAGSNAETLKKLLVEPKCFDPRVDIPDGWFLWPWQRSISMVQDSSHAHYSPIDTTSLVFDLRKSTMVLKQLKIENKGEFPAFIGKIVKAAKNAVFDWGGFFDKETGDGIVAHFCDFELEGTTSPSSSYRAFQAAEQMIREVRGLCEDIQSKLTMGIGSLGASVGLHSDKAVWTCNNGLINGLGDSVIMAARFCAEAENYSIFVSNHEYRILDQELPGDQVQRFTRTDYQGKEFDKSAGLFGYQYTV